MYDNYDWTEIHDFHHIIFGRSGPCFGKELTLTFDQMSLVRKQLDTATVHRTKACENAKCSFDNRCKFAHPSAYKRRCPMNGVPDPGNFDVMINQAVARINENAHLIKELNNALVRASTPKQKWEIKLELERCKLPLSLRYFPLLCQSGTSCTVNDCMFAHTPEELNYHPLVFKTRPCQFYHTGQINCPVPHCSKYHKQNLTSSILVSLFTFRFDPETPKQLSDEQRLFRHIGRNFTPAIEEIRALVESPEAAAIASCGGNLSFPARSGIVGRPLTQSSPLLAPRALPPCGLSKYAQAFAPVVGARSHSEDETAASLPSTAQALPHSASNTYPHVAAQPSAHTQNSSPLGTVSIHSEVPPGMTPLSMPSAPENVASPVKTPPATAQTLTTAPSPATQQFVASPLSSSPAANAFGSACVVNTATNFAPSHAKQPLNSTHEFLMQVERLHREGFPGDSPTSPAEAFQQSPPFTPSPGTLPSPLALARAAPMPLLHSGEWHQPQVMPTTGGYWYPYPADVYPAYYPGQQYLPPASKASPHWPYECYPQDGRPVYMPPGGAPYATYYAGAAPAAYPACPGMGPNYA